MVRLFLAVLVPPRVKNELGEEIERIKKQLPDWQINWVEPKNLHVTLIFLGWVEEQQIPEIKKEVSGAVNDGFKSLKIKTGPLNISNRPIWLELDSGAQELNNLYQKILINLAFKGPESVRPYHPHLTLGRTKKRGKSKPKEIKKSYSWSADKVILYESKPRRTGSVYEELASFPL